MYMYIQTLIIYFELADTLLILRATPSLRVSLISDPPTFQALSTQPTTNQTTPTSHTHHSQVEEGTSPYCTRTSLSNWDTLRVGGN